MNYHASALSSIVSLCILFFVVAVVLINPLSSFVDEMGQQVVDSFLARLFTSGELTISVGSIDPQLFSSLILHTIAVIDQSSKEIVHIDHITVDMPLYRLLLRSHTKQDLTIRLSGVQCSVAFDEVAGLGDMPGSVFPFDQRLAIELEDVEGTFTFADFSLTCEKGEAMVHWGPQNGLTDLWFTADAVTASADSFRAHVLNPYVSYDIDADHQTVGSFSSDTLFLEALNSLFTVRSLTAAMTSTDAASFGQGTGSATLSSESLTVEGVFCGAAEGLGARLSLANWSVANAQVAGSETALSYGQWAIEIPRLTASYTQEAVDMFMASLHAPDAVYLRTNEKPVGYVSGLSLAAARQETVKSVRAGWDTALLEEPQILFGNANALRQIRVDDTHILLIDAQENPLLSVEMACDCSVTTDDPRFPTVEAKIAGDMTLLRDLNIKRAYVQADMVNIPHVPGSLRANISYEPFSEDGTDVLVQVLHDDGLATSLSYNSASEQAKVSISLKDIHPWDFRELIGIIVEGADEFLIPQTSIEGNASFSFSRDLKEGRGSAEIGIAELAIENRRFNMAATIAGTMNEQVFAIDLATLTGEGIRLAFSGSLDRVHFFPEGNLHVANAASGEILLQADFVRSSAQSYHYEITSARVENAQLSGDISWARENMLTVEALLALSQTSYAIDALYDEKNAILSLYTQGLDAVVDFRTHPGYVVLQAHLDDFSLPFLTNRFMQGITRIDGSLDADVSLADGAYRISSDMLKLSGLSWAAGEPWDMSFACTIDSSHVSLEHVSYHDPLASYEGFILLENDSLKELLNGSLSSFSLLAVLTGDEGKSIEASLYPDDMDSSISRGSVTVRQLDLGHYDAQLHGALLDITAVGATDMQSMLDANAKLDLVSDSYAASVELYTDENGVFLTQGSLAGPSFSLDRLTGTFLFFGAASLKTQLFAPSSNTWRDASSHAGIMVETEFPRTADFFSWVGSLRSIKEELPPLTVTHADAVLYGAIAFPDGSHQVLFRNNTLSVEPLEGGTLSAYYCFDDGTVNVKTYPGFPVSLHASGSIDGDRIALRIDNITFDLVHLNALLAVPLFVFEDGTLQGELRIEGSIDDPKYYGTLVADYIRLQLFWLPTESVSVLNPIITISENAAHIPITHMSFAHDTGGFSTATLTAHVTIEQWNVPHYQIDIEIGKDPITLWLPIPFPQLEINVYTELSGKLSIDGTPFGETVLGEVVISNGQVSFDIPEELPEWYYMENRTSVDLTVVTGKNFSFVYPHEEAPIIRAAFADNQRVHLNLKAPDMTGTISGQLALQSGEIYYVQKNFYITEGSIAFPVSPISTAIDPIINMRARLREFDQQGNRIDIYLVLQDARISSITPRLESVPSLPMDEIVALLGQNIIASQSAEDTGFSPLVAMASTATDVMSRLGLMQGSPISLGFPHIVKDALGLDVFTIRTNIVQNVLFTALTGPAGGVTGSPVARYLDNTAMYIGKYFLKDFYFQALVHMRYDRWGNSPSFFIEDLAIDTEVSVEWDTPLATLTFFTRPVELSAFDLFDTMGFSITKRFQF